MRQEAKVREFKRFQQPLLMMICFRLVKLCITLPSKPIILHLPLDPPLFLKFKQNFSDDEIDEFRGTANSSKPAISSGTLFVKYFQLLAYGS